MIHLYDLFKWSIQIFVIVCLFIHMAHLDESSKWILCLFFYFHFHSNEFSKQITKIPLYWFNHMFDIKFNYITFNNLVEYIYIRIILKLTIFLRFGQKKKDLSVLARKHIFRFWRKNKIFRFWRENEIFGFSGKTCFSFVLAGKHVFAILFGNAYN